MSHQVVCQEWEESERGWGVRPDGATLHLTMEDCRKFREEFWKRELARTGGEVPDEYSRESGEPYMKNVDGKTYRQLRMAKKRKQFGIRAG